ncbi:MAG: alpha/beta hydrolase family protein [Cyclobacteriaceae bacterium]
MSNKPSVSLLLVCLSLCFACTYVPQAEQSLNSINIQGEPGSFHGFRMYSFEFQGRQSRIVVPKIAADGNPWVWRARFFGHRPEVDMALLSRGYFVAFIDVSDLYGSAEAVRLWNEFYAYLTSEYDFAPEVALEGMSRGGLIVFNWTAANPEKVACIYADAPVCDLRSWPGGKMSGRGSSEDWQKSLSAYKLTEEEAMQFAGNPVDKAEILVKAKIPLLVVSGDADDIVPYEENAQKIVEAYKKAKLKPRVILKEGVGHTHGLDDPQPIIDFILKHSP